MHCYTYLTSSPIAAPTTNTSRLASRAASAATVPAWLPDSRQAWLGGGVVVGATGHGWQDRCTVGAGWHGMAAVGGATGGQLHGGPTGTLGARHPS